MTSLSLQYGRFHLQIFKRLQLLSFSTDLDKTGIKIHGLLRSFIWNIVIIRVAVPFNPYLQHIISWWMYTHHHHLHLNWNQSQSGTPLHLWHLWSPGGLVPLRFPLLYQLPLYWYGDHLGLGKVTCSVDSFYYLFWFKKKIIKELWWSLCILVAPKWVLWQTVKTQMKCSIMLHFIWICTVCED